MIGGVHLWVDSDRTNMNAIGTKKNRISQQQARGQQSVAEPVFFFTGLHAALPGSLRADQSLEELIELQILLGGEQAEHV